jgi:hypothetical protein
LFVVEREAPGADVCGRLVGGVEAGSEDVDLRISGQDIPTKPTGPASVSTTAVGGGPTSGRCRTRSGSPSAARARAGAQLPTRTRGCRPGRP